GGLTFVNASTGLPDVPVSRLVVSPLDKNTVFAATFLGVYRTTDGGAHWRRPSLCGGGRHLHGARCLLPAHRELWPRCLGNPSIKRNSTFCSSAVPFGTALPVLHPWRFALFVA